MAAMTSANEREETKLRRSTMSWCSTTTELAAILHLPCRHEMQCGVEVCRKTGANNALSFYPWMPQGRKPRPVSALLRHDKSRVLIKATAARPLESSGRDRRARCSRRGGG